MIYEIYSDDGLPFAVEHRGNLDSLLNLISQSVWLFGRDRRNGKAEAFHCKQGENVKLVSECGDDWDKVMIVQDATKGETP